MLRKMTFSSGCRKFRWLKKIKNSLFVFFLDELEDALERLGRRHPMLVSRVIAGDDGCRVTEKNGSTNTL